MKMLKEMRWKLLIVLFIAVLSACKKADTVEIPKEFPVDLLAERWEVKRETRLFTNNREITDPNVIRDFADRQGVDDAIESPEDGILADPLVLRFVSESEAAFRGEDGQSIPYDVDRKGNRFLFYAKQTIGVNPSAVPSVNDFGYLYNMLKYTDKLGAPGFGGIRQTRQVLVAHGNYKVIKISALAFAYKRSFSASGGSPFNNDDPFASEVFETGGVILNEFDPRVRQFVGLNDTLAVKEYAIICTLRK